MNTRSASAPIGGGTTEVEAKCQGNEVNGYFEVDGEEGVGNPKVCVNLGATRETREGFRAAVSRSPFDVGDLPREVTAFLRCLVTS